MVTNVTRTEVQHLVAEGAILVDVRPPQEYAGEHIVGAIGLPLKELDATTAARTLERDRPVIVY